MQFSGEGKFKSAMAPQRAKDKKQRASLPQDVEMRREERNDVQWPSAKCGYNHTIATFLGDLLETA